MLISYARRGGLTDFWTRNNPHVSSQIKDLRGNIRFRLKGIALIISNSENYIFVHIPKTAGTAVTRALGETIHWNDVVLAGGAADHFHRSRFGLWKHSRAEEIKSVVGDTYWAQSFTFGFVRDPYERMRSLYTFTERLLHDEGLRRHLTWIGRFGNRPPFSWGWVKAYRESKTFSDYIRNPRLLEDQVAVPMSNYLMQDGKLIVDFVGKHEEMATDFGVICERLGKPPPELKKHNTSGSSNALDSYFRSHADYDWVYEKYEVDFVNFGYERR